MSGRGGRPRGEPPAATPSPGAHASFTLSDGSLERCAELMREFNAGLHIHVAEDACDVEDARSRYGTGIVERLLKHDALNARTILAHGIHLSSDEIDLAKSAGASTSGRSVPRIPARSSSAAADPASNRHTFRAKRSPTRDAAAGSLDGEGGGNRAPPNKGWGMDLGARDARGGRWKLT